ncbi:MAG TPA: DUF5916 domain-containing protein, partial [Longimicrobiales bacterium]|nr:DUF5916 domain-containing protein [Longimicrobiales bacterium]
MLTTIAAALQLALTPQPAAPVQTVFHGRQNQTVVSIQKQNVQVKLDGVLDDAAWKGAVMLTGFSQFDPVDGLPAADSTEVYVTYTDHEIYFGIRAFEPHGAVNAKLADRDKIFGGDYVDIMLDTFNDHRRAYEFVSNPFGVQADGVYSESPQTNEDFTPDFLFQSKGRLTDFGYEIEMRIPFKSIGYQPKDVQDWGIQVFRRVQHSGQNQTWTPARKGTTSLLSQNGTLQGLSQLKRGLVLDINPVATAHLDGKPVAGNFKYGSAEPEFGGNIRWGLTTNLTLNATVNPDFSQIESDASQVVFDPRQALFFPEKRPFFLENSEQLQAPSRLIYTRRIVSPNGAVKFTGKVGSTNIGYLSAVDDASLSATGDDHPLYNILRLKRDIGKQNTIGLVYTDKELAGDYNRVIGLDTRVTFK